MTTSTEPCWESSMAAILWCKTLTLGSLLPGILRIKYELRTGPGTGNSFFLIKTSNCWWDESWWDERLALSIHISSQRCSGVFRCQLKFHVIVHSGSHSINDDLIIFGLGHRACGGKGKNGKDQYFFSHDTNYSLPIC